MFPWWKFARILGQPEIAPSARTEAVLIPALHWKIRVSHLCLIIPEEALTAVANVYLTLFPAEADEVHDPCELFVRQLQIRLSRSTSNWEDRKDTPPFYAHLDQKIP